MHLGNGGCLEQLPKGPHSGVQKAECAHAITPAMRGTERESTSKAWLDPDSGAQ